MGSCAWKGPAPRQPERASGSQLLWGSGRPQQSVDLLLVEQVQEEIPESGHLMLESGPGASESSAVTDESVGDCECLTWGELQIGEGLVRRVGG